jgi:predicted nucleic acid-binding protein
MMSNLDVEILVQVYNEKLYAMMTELVVKETTIRQLNKDVERLMEVVRTQRVPKDDKVKKDKESSN